MDMPFCRICGAALDEGARFCRICGTPLEPNQPPIPQPQPSSENRQSNQLVSYRKPSNQTLSHFQLNERVVQYVVVPILLLAILAVKIWLALQYRMQTWDAYSYLSNARTFYLLRPLDAYHFFEILRPPAFPFIISLVWRITGESYAAAAVLNPIFAVGGAYVFFLLLKNMFGLKEGVVGSLLLMASLEVFVWTNQILVHGVGMFFMILSVYIFWLAIAGRGTYYFPLAGVALALAALTRYTLAILIPVFPIMLLVLWFSSRAKSRTHFPWKSLGLMVLGFVLPWAPWLAWNYLNAGNPLASVLAGAEFVSGNAEPWYFYIVNMPLLLTIPGSILLLVGLIDKKTLHDKGNLILFLWLTIFFAFSSIIQHKEARYLIDYAPPLVAFATLGVCRIESRLPSKTRMVAWILVALWISAAFYPAFTSSLTDANDQSYGSDAFMAAAAWVDSNTNQTTIGISESPTAFSYQTDRLFYNLDLVNGIAQSEGISPDQLMHEIGIRIAVVSADTAQDHSFHTDPNYALVEQFSPYQIYMFNCQNCTKV